MAGTSLKSRKPAGTGSKGDDQVYTISSDDDLTDADSTDAGSASGAPGDSSKDKDMGKDGKGKANSPSSSGRMKIVLTLPPTRHRPPRKSPSLSMPPILESIT